MAKPARKFFKVLRPSLLAVPVLLLVAVLQVAFTQAPAPAASRLAAQNALFEESWQAKLKMNPMLATAVGDYRYKDSRLGDSASTVILVGSPHIARSVQQLRPAGPQQYSARHQGSNRCSHDDSR